MNYLPVESVHLLSKVFGTFPFGNGNFHLDSWSIKGDTTNGMDLNYVMENSVFSVVAWTYVMLLKFCV